MIDGMFNGGALPALERLVQFTEARHRVLTQNIANVSTPGYKPKDLSVAAFQSSLRDAIDERRRYGTDSGFGATGIKPDDAGGVHYGDDGLTADATAPSSGILFHDENNRDIERMMQHLSENTTVHNAAIELMRSEYAVLHAAIRQRV